MTHARRWGWLGFCLVLACWATPIRGESTYDLVIYGATSGGIVAAVQAKILGLSVVLIEPGRHLGGMSSGGLGATDIGNKAAIGGLSREFYRRVFRHYQQDSAWTHETRQSYLEKRRLAPGEETMWTFEPHVAEAIYHDWLAQSKVNVVFGQRLQSPGGVQKTGLRITRLVMESGATFDGRMFIDASYEGDLLALAGCAYHVGRESNATYDETLNGVQLGSKTHQFKVDVDPYVRPGDPTSGLLPGIHAGLPGEQGTGDRRVQAYNFRLCLTDVPENRLPPVKPANFDPLRYELALRTILAGQWDGLGHSVPMPNRKTDTNNNGAFSTDHIGMNYDYPDGDYATRKRIWDDHRSYIQGWHWFLANDPRVPKAVQEEARRWGLSKDEFTDDVDHWPHQMYVREARRLIGEYVMTQHNCQGRDVAPHPVGLAAYNMDSHNVQRYVLNGVARNEGDVQVGVSPYPIAYEAIVPRRAECANLLVPVCMSSSHIAYGSIRMEPVFMVLGQSAATAAQLALSADVAVQDIDYKRLQKQLLDDQQVLEWSGSKLPVGRRATDLPGTVLDDGAAEWVGEWSLSSVARGFVGDGYRHDGNEQPGRKSATFRTRLPTSGRYEVRISYAPQANRATNVPVTITHAAGETKLLVNQRLTPAIDGLFHSLGTFTFDAEHPAGVTFATRGTDGHVIVDAVQWLPVKK